MAELTVMVPVGDREVEMRKPSDGALVVLSRVARGLPKNMIENDGGERSKEMVDRLVRSLGTLGKIVENMLVKEDDRDWLEDAMIDGSVSAEDVFDSIRVAGEKFNGSTVPAKSAPPVRRRR